MPDFAIINDEDFKTVLRRRKFTLRRQLKIRIANEDVPEENDKLVRELRIVRNLQKVLST